MSASIFFHLFHIFILLVAFLFPTIESTGAEGASSFPTFKKSVLLCPIYPTALISQFCEKSAPSLFVEAVHYEPTVLQDSELLLLERELSVSSTKKKAFEFLDKKFKTLSQSENPFSNLTLVYEIQNLFTNQSAFLSPKKKNYVKETNQKKRIEQEWVKPIVTLLSEIIDCYDKLERKSASTLCDLSNLFSLHQFLDQSLFPFLTHLPRSTSFPLVQSLTQDENMHFRRWIVLDVALQTLLRQVGLGLNLQPFIKALEFPEAFYELSEPTQKQLYEAALRSYQSLQKVGTWIRTFKETSSFQFMFLKSSLGSLLQPSLEKILSSILPLREDL